jgi:hypothetical protein
VQELGDVIGREQLVEPAHRAPPHRPDGRARWKDAPLRLRISRSGSIPLNRGRARKQDISAASSVARGARGRRRGHACPRRNMRARG